MSSSDPPTSLRALLGVAASVALLAGVYGRFKGLGLWPLGVDEFYVSRSVDNILRSGLPGFPCGGYYTRGILYQYLVAGIRLLGSSPEFAGRLVASLASLAVLPAAFLLGKRVQGSLVGWLTAIILCISVWEIEMARFARMYAPFQAVFAWYVIFFLRYTVDRRDSALAWMVGLSVLGVSVWEGGVLLGFANIFAVLITHDHGRLRSGHTLRLLGLSGLVCLLFLATHDMRGFASAPAASPMTAAPALENSQGLFHLVAASLGHVRNHWQWGVAALIPLFAVWRTLAWIRAAQFPWVTAVGFCAVLGACAMHCFTLASGFIMLMMLARLIDWHDLAAPRARIFWFALTSMFAFWVTFYLSFQQSSLGLQRFSGTVLPPVAQFLFGFPDVYDEVLRPWLRTLPLLSAALGTALVYMGWHALNARSETSDTIASMLGLLLFIVLVVGAIPTNRIETRYTFFLYPVLMVLGVTALMMWLRSKKALRRLPVALSAAIPLLCFSATEDFQPQHIAAIDSARVNFRIGMTPARAAHYYPRNDMRAVGEWLRAHVRPEDLVITGIPSLDPYYPNFDYFLLLADDARYESYLCRDGRTERWTNHTILYTMAALEPLVDSGRRIFAAVYSDTEASLFAAAQSRGWSVERIGFSAAGNPGVLLVTRDVRPQGR